MGASRKLMGEIDRVLKKVQEGVDVFDSIWNKVYDTDNANQKEKFEADLKKEIKKLQRYRDQIKTWIQSSEIKDKKALMDARKLIEREMERFKVCEKETKTKAFSKEGLGLQPKTDPKEKAKSETRDWLNNVVGDLESQIDNFEAEVEGLSVVKKGKTRQPRLTHLETSISRHKAHIMKLELLLRLLDNDELSPEQVNDVKDFLEDYLERNQDSFEEFEDIDELYSSLPLDKVEALEDLVALGASGLVKAALIATSHQNTAEEQNEEAATQDTVPDITPKTPPSKSGAVGSLMPAASPSPIPATTGPIPVSTINSLAIPLVGGPTAKSIPSSPAAARTAIENSGAPLTPSAVNLSSSVKEEDSNMFPVRKPSPAIPEIGMARGHSKGISDQAPISGPMTLGSIVGISNNGSVGSVPFSSDMAKRNVPSADERIGTDGLAPSLVSPLSNRILLQPAVKSNDGTSNDFNSVGDVRAFSPSGPPGVQWRPQSSTAFQNQSETTGQFRGRPEIAPDQREKFLQRLQQVQQQGQNTLLNVPNLQGLNQKPLSMQQHNSLLQQFNSQSSSLSPHLGLGLNIQSTGLNSAPAQSQSPIPQQSSPNPTMPADVKDAGPPKGDEQQQQQQNLSDDLNTESVADSSLNKVAGDDDAKSAYSGAASTTTTESNQVPRDTDLSPGQLLQHNQSSASLGVIGRRSASDLGAVGDNVGGSAGNFAGMHDQLYNMQMLDAAYFRLPQPKDSERTKSYVPRHPVATPASFPRTQADIVENPAFWERMGLDQMGTDALFFAFYYQPNTYQQYLAARELKRQSWRFHRKYNTWFQRHEEPKVANDEYEKGTYVYFDFHIADDMPQQGWCQRIKTEFTFEYNYLEDELVV